MVRIAFATKKKNAQKFARAGRKRGFKTGIRKIKGGWAIYNFGKRKK